LKVNCFEWKKKQSQGDQATALAATTANTYSVSLTATAVAGCRHEEYSYVPADQEEEPTHWSFDAYEHCEEDEGIQDPENQEVIAFEDPYGAPSDLTFREECNHIQVWKMMMADVAEEQSAAKRTSVAAEERTPIDVEDDRKPAAKKRAPVDPPADLMPQSYFLNKTVLKPTPLRMVLEDAPEVLMETGPEQGVLNNDIKRYAITTDRTSTVAKTAHFRTHGDAKLTANLDPDPMVRATSSTLNPKACGERNKEFPEDLIRAICVETDPEKNEKLFEIKVDNIPSPACPDDRNDPGTESHENTVKTEDDPSGTYDHKKITDFPEEEKQESEGCRIEKTTKTKTKTKMIPDKIFSSTNNINDQNHVSDSPILFELLYNELMLDEWYWNAFGKDLDNKPLYHQKYYED